MSKEIKRALTNGLVTGYAGGKPADVSRAGFAVKASHVEQEGSVYHDEWFVGKHLGGGQELVLVNGQRFTRLYAGGTPEPEVLEPLGITENDVNTYLKNQIIEHGENTRLFEDCTPEAEGDWRYAYNVTSSDASIGVTTGMEKIDYRGTVVHIHAFILSPVK
jgi:hypothetical protein